jgi:hypothetical protein
MANDFSGSKKSQFKPFKQFKKFKPSQSKAASYISSFMPALEFLSFEQNQLRHVCRGHGVPERHLNLPLRRGGDKKRVTELPKDAVMTMKEQEGIFVS